MLGMVGRKIRKAYRGRQVPHGKQSVRKLMAHGTATNSIELSGDAKSFDRVARKWNVDYAFYKTGPDKYLLFFKAGQADAMTACFSEYSRKVLSNAERAELANGVKSEHPALVAFTKHQNIDQLSRELLVELIDHIKVYENGNISVRFKFADEFRRIAEYIEINTTKPAVAG